MRVREARCRLGGLRAAAQTASPCAATQSASEAISARFHRTQRGSGFAPLDTVKVAEMRILLAIDGSECSALATRAVIAQLRPQDTDVRVIHAVNWEHILPISLQFERGSEAAHAYQDLRDRTARDAGALVAGAARQLQDAGFSTSTEVQEGEPRRVILDDAAAWRPDLIVVGSRGKNGLDRLLLGSTSEHIARHATCSVEIVRKPTAKSKGLVMSRSEGNPPPR